MHLIGWTIIRVWRLPTALASVVVCWLLWGVLNTPLAVPGRSSVSEYVWPLVPAIFVVTAMRSSSTMHTPIVASCPGKRRKKLLLAGSILIVGFALLLVEPGEAERTVIARNLAYLLGFGWLVLSTFGFRVAMVACAILPAFMWILGSNGTGIEPAVWAILLTPGGRIDALAAPIVLIIGLSAFVGFAGPLTETS